MVRLLLLSVTIAGVAGTWNVQLAEDALDLLPGPAVTEDLATLQKLGVINRVFISLEVANENSPATLAGQQTALKNSADTIGSILAASPLFSDSFYRLPEGYEFKIYNIISSLLPSLVGEKDLPIIAERLEPDFLLRQLKENFIRLNTLAGIALVNSIREDPLELSSIIMKKFMSLKGGMKMQVIDGFFFSQDGRSCLIWAESRLPLTSSASASLVMDELQRAFEGGLSPGVKAGIIGALPHTMANAETIKADLKKLLPAAMVVLSFFLLVFLKDIRALLVVAIPFLAAPPAIALVAVFFGTVSSMALGFGIVLLGIGVDFAVHIFLGCADSNEPTRIPEKLKRSLLTAALTTIAVFIVLLFSEVPSHKQMAFLAISGLSWALVLAWFLVPGIAAGYARSHPGRKMTRSGGGFSGRVSRATGRVAVLLWLVLVTVGIFCAPGLQYNGDLKALDAPSVEVQADETRFIATWGHGQDQAFIVASGNSRREVLDINDRIYLKLQETTSLAGVQSIAPLLPGPVRQRRNIKSWRSFWQERLDSFAPSLEETSVAAGFTAGAFRPFMEKLESEPTIFDPEIMLDGPLRPLMKSLFSEGGDSGKGTGSFLVATVVPDNDEFRPILREVAETIEGARVISNSRWRAEVEKLLAADIVRLSLAAALVVILICAVFFRNPVKIFAVLAPVIAALAAMVIFSRLTGGDLNIMHLLMGIMVIGISVDYGIFVARSFQSPISEATFKAVTVCAVSTLSGFGILALAAHPALRALGSTVLVGIGVAWPVALFVTPVLLGLTRSEK